LVTGQFKGLLQDANGNTIAINGLWNISSANNSAPGSYDPAGAPGSELYFTAKAPVASSATSNPLPRT
jgi:hypothetical protein